MSGDGAHLGVGVARALKTILGGEPSPDKTQEETMNPVKMRDYLESATPGSYDSTAAYAGKLVLHWLLEDPRRAQGPVENEYDWGTPDPATGHSFTITNIGWYDLMKRDGIDLGSLDLTGFMWGWACNAARFCVELGPVANPAIMTIDIDKKGSNER